MEYIKLRHDPEELANKAYSEGFYVEAIQILHCFLENQARSLVMLIGNVHFNAAQADTWDIADTFSFQQCLKILFVLNQISKEQFLEFNKFNQLRNHVVHQLYKEPYEKMYLGIPKSKFDEIFHKTMEQIYIFTRKNEDLVG